jgi:cytochrome c peroxidase
MGNNPLKQRIQIATGVYINLATAKINTVSAVKKNDLGLYEITQNPQHRWHYKTPSLRNIALSAPYMHNGQFSTLQQVVEFYNQGGIAHKNLSPLIKPLHLNHSEIQALVAFLKALTGSNVTKLMEEGLAEPIGNPID